MLLVSTLCRLPCVRDGVVNLHWEQWEILFWCYLVKMYGRELDYAAIL